MTKHRRLAAVAALVLVPSIALSACSSSSSSGGSSSASSSPTESASPSQSLVTTSLTADQVEVKGGITQAPQITFPTPSSASELTTKDVVVGTGATVKAGDTITFSYTGVGALSGKVFDSSWERGQPLTYPLTGLITGWQQGIPGMKVGGRRILVIPGDLAYGPNPPTPAIAPNETLVFVMDIVKIG